MNKLIVSAIVTSLLAPVVTFASGMPNYVGTDYKQPTNCIVPPDHGIYGLEGSNYVLTGCITDEAWQRSIVAATQRTFLFGAFNQAPSVTLKNGRFETCPGMNGCAVDPVLIR